MAIQHNHTVLSKPSVASFLAGAFGKIDEYRRLPANWDGEDALPVGDRVSVRARNLLRLVAKEAMRSGVLWKEPSVAPNPEGGLELSWERGHRWVTLVIDPNRVKTGCAAQEDEAEPQFQWVSGDEAVEKALWALRGG